MERYAGGICRIDYYFYGGEMPLSLKKDLKNTIFANHELVLAGLNTILDYNADRKQSL